MAKMSVEELCLTWDDHHKTLIGVFEKLLESSSLVDCTIAAEGQYLKAHKVVLSACSPYFELLFAQENEKNPIVILKDISFQDLKALIDFIYSGKVQIPEDRLGDFTEAAESLQIKGLGDGRKESIAESLGRISPGSHRKEGGNLPTRKRRRNSFSIINEQTEGGAIPEVIMMSKSPRNESVPSCSAPAIVTDSGTSSSAPSHAFGVQKKSSETNSSCIAERLVDHAGEVRPQPMTEIFLPEMNCLVEPKSEVCVDEISEFRSDEEAEDSMLLGMDEEDNINSVYSSPHSVVKQESDNSILPGPVTQHSNAGAVSSVCEDSRLRLPVPSAGPEVFFADLRANATPGPSAEVARPKSTSSKSPARSVPGPSSSRAGVMEQRLGSSRNRLRPELRAKDQPFRGGGENDIFPSGEGEQDHLTGQNVKLEAHEEIIEGAGARCDRHPPPATAARPAALTAADVHTSSSRLAAHTSVAAPVHTAFSLPGSSSSRAVSEELPRRCGCVVCGMAFYRPSELARHTHTHTDDRPFSCDYCGKTFKLKGHLQMHQRIHTGDRPFMCKQCGKAFSRKGTLRVHQLTHTGDRPYKCDQCGNTFALKGNLQMHQRIHTGDRPYRCDECGFSTAYSHHLLRHKRKVHGGSSPKRRGPRD